MATLLTTRIEPLQIDLGRLEQEPNALQGYHEEIQHRIMNLLPPLGETLKLTERTRIQVRLNERESALGIATLRADSLILLSQFFREEGLDIADHLFGSRIDSLKILLLTG